MWTNDAQINYKMSACYGVNLLILGKSHKDKHLYTDMSSPGVSKPQGIASQLHKKV